MVDSVKKIKYESVALDIEQKDLLKYMMFAHEQDITFNQLIENAIRDNLYEGEG